MAILHYVLRSKCHPRILPRSCFFRAELISNPYKHLHVDVANYELDWDLIAAPSSCKINSQQKVKYRSS